MDTITVTFPQVNINLPFDDISFNSSEQMIFDISQRIGRKALEKLLHDIDERLKVERPKGTLENTGMRQKYFLTRLGDIRYKRTRYIDKTTGKPRYLLEEKLKIQKNQRISLVRAKIEMFIANLVPYRGAKEHITLLTGCRRSHESIRQSIIQEAKRIIAHQEHAIDRQRRLEDDAPQASYDIAYLETDSAFIRRQRSKKRTGKRVYRIKAARRRRKRRSIEVKLAVGYTDKVKRYKHGRAKSLRLENKFTYASVENGRMFMEKLSLLAEKKLSPSRAKALIFGGDGGSYITRGIKDYFVNVIYVLCKFHLKRNIKRALAHRPAIQPVINELLKKDSIDKALSLIARLIQRTNDRKEKKSLKELHTYIDQNKEGINSIKRIKDKALRERVKGSGAMESNVDKFLAHRFKKRGMSWSPKGALSLLKVRETITNGEWDAWWSEKRDEKIEISPEPLKQLTAKDLWKVRGKNTLPLLEATIPAFRGPDQNEPWAKVLRQLQDIDYYKQN